MWLEANKRRIRVVVLVCLLLMSSLAVFVPRSNAQTPVVLDSYPEANYSGSTLYLSCLFYPNETTYARSATGQAVKTPNDGEIYLLDSVKAYLGKFGSPTGAFAVASIIDNNTGSFGTSFRPQTCTPLAVSEPLNISTLPTIPTMTLRQFNFTGANRVTLSPNTAYSLAIWAINGTINDTNRIDIGYDQTSPTHAGNTLGRLTGTGNPPSSWFTTASTDMIFYLYGMLAGEVTFYHNVGGAVLFDGATRSNGSSAYFARYVTYVLVGAPTNASYLFLNFTYAGSSQTTNSYAFNVTNDVTIWTYFGVTPTATPYILARFSWSPANPTPLEAVSFDGTLSNSSSEITSYVWAFGDGETGTGSTTVHSYDSAGAKTVTLTVESSVGTDAFSSYVVVSSGLSAEEEPSAGSHVFAPTPNALPWFVGQIVTGAGAIALLDYLNKKIRKIGPQKVKKRIHTVIKRAFTRREWGHVEN